MTIADVIELRKKAKSLFSDCLGLSSEFYNLRFPRRNSRQEDPLATCELLRLRQQIEMLANVCSYVTNDLTKILGFPADGYISNDEKH